MNLYTGTQLIIRTQKKSPHNKKIKFTPVVIKELVLVISAMVGEGHPGSF